MHHNTFPTLVWNTVGVRVEVLVEVVGIIEVLLVEVAIEEAIVIVVEFKVVAV